MTPLSSLLFLLPLAITDISNVENMKKRELMQIVGEAFRGKGAGGRTFGRRSFGRRGGVQLRSCWGAGPLKVTANVSTPVQLGRPMTISCNANQALQLCVLKPPSKEPHIFTPATQREDGRIRLSKGICEIFVDDVESKDFGKWRCLVRSRCMAMKGLIFDLSKSPEPQLDPKPEVYMATNNGYHGGLVMKFKGQLVKVISFNIPGDGSAGKKSKLRMKKLTGASVLEDVITLGETTYKRHVINMKMPSHVERGKLPKPGLYATRFASNTNPGWYNEAAKIKKLGNSIGVIAFAYQGLDDGNFTGIKMIGDNYVPAGKPSTFINTDDSDNTADTINALMRFAGPGYKHPMSLRRYQLHLEDKMDTQLYFMMSHVPEEQRHNLEYIHFDQMEKLIED